VISYYTPLLFEII